MKVNIDKVRPLLESMYDHRKEMVPCFIGAPGIGKTQGIYQFAKDIGVNVVTFILSNTVPSEVSGMRMPDKDTKRMEVFDDMRMSSLKDGDILFFDEILEAPPMLWSACLTLIQDRVMASGRKLPDVFIVAASNPVASPGIIPASVRDRFMFIEVKFDMVIWSDYIREKYGVNPAGLAHYIQDDSNQYNILTPRRAEKLYTWLANGPKEGSIWDCKIDCIKSMFDAVIADKIAKLVKGIMSPKDQLYKALVEIDVKVPDGFDNMSMEEILTALSSMPEWDHIAEVLSNIELKEEESEVSY